VFETTPGNWGRKRVPVNMREFAHLLPVVEPPEATAAPQAATRAPQVVTGAPKVVGRRWSSEQLTQLANFAGRNLIALLRGATPAFYLPDVPDANVSGAVLTVAGAGEALQLVRLTLQGGVPLQASLFALVEAAAAHVAGRATGVSPRSIDHVGLTVVMRPQLMGGVADVAKHPFDPQTMGLIVAGPQHGVVTFDPAQTAEGLARRAVARLAEEERAAATFFSVAVESTEPSLLALV
jgi:hypothetical protein